MKKLYRLFLVAHKEYPKNNTKYTEPLLNNADFFIVHAFCAITKERKRQNKLNHFQQILNLI